MIRACQPMDRGLRKRRVDFSLARGFVNISFHSSSRNPSQFCNIFHHFLSTNRWKAEGQGFLEFVITMSGSDFSFYPRRRLRYGRQPLVVYWHFWLQDPDYSSSYSWICLAVNKLLQFIWEATNTRSEERGSKVYLTNLFNQSWLPGQKLWHKCWTTLLKAKID